MTSRPRGARGRFASFKTKKRAQCRTCGRVCPETNKFFCSSKCRWKFKRKKKPGTKDFISWVNAKIEESGYIDKGDIVDAASELGLTMNYINRLLTSRLGLATILNGDSFYVTKRKGRTKKWFVALYGPATDADIENMEGILKRHGYKETEAFVPQPWEYTRRAERGMLYYLEPLDTKSWMEDLGIIYGEATTQEELSEDSVPWEEQIRAVFRELRMGS